MSIRDCIQYVQDGKAVDVSGREVLLEMLAAVEEQQVQAGGAWPDIAASAYRAYWIIRGKTYPQFCKIKPEFQVAIEVAVRQAVSVFCSGSQAYNWEEKRAKKV